MADPRKNSKLHQAWTALGFAAGLGLTGCLPADTTLQDYSPFSYGNWRQIPSRSDVHVERVKLKHFAAFQPRAIRLDEGEQARLEDFVLEGNLRQGDRIQVQVPMAKEGAKNPVTKARIDYLSGELTDLGLPIRVVETAALPSGSDQLTIVVDRAMAVPPDCTAEEPWIANRPDYRIGCAYNSALGMMVADPRDLVRGRALGPGDGETTARGIKGYREPDEREQDTGGLKIELTSGE